MAVDAPKGLVPIRHLNGSPWNGMVKKVVVSTSDATAIFIGDLVYYSGSSPTSGAKIGGEDVAGIPIVQRLTASSSADPANLAGVVVGRKPDPDNLMRKHRAASTDAILYIAADPDVVFEVQEDAASTPIVAASIGLNANIAFGSGDATTGVSGLEIDSDTVATTAALPLKVIGLSKKVDNDFYAGNGNVNGKFEVVLNWVLHGVGIGGTTGAV